MMVEKSSAGPKTIIDESKRNENGGNRYILFMLWK